MGGCELAEADEAARSSYIVPVGKPRIRAIPTYTIQSLRLGWRGAWCINGEVDQNSTSRRTQAIHGTTTGFVFVALSRRYDLTFLDFVFPFLSQPSLVGLRAGPLWSNVH